MLPFPLSNAMRIDDASGILSRLTVGVAARQYSQYVQSGLTTALLQLRPGDEGVTTAPSPASARA